MTHAKNKPASQIVLFLISQIACTFYRTIPKINPFCTCFPILLLCPILIRLSYIPCPTYYWFSDSLRHIDLTLPCWSCFAYACFPCSLQQICIAISHPKAPRSMFSTMITLSTYYYLCTSLWIHAFSLHFLLFRSPIHPYVFSYFFVIHSVFLTLFTLFFSIASAFFAIFVLFFRYFFCCLASICFSLRFSFTTINEQFKNKAQRCLYVANIQEIIAKGAQKTNLVNLCTPFAICSFIWCQDQKV